MIIIEGPDHTGKTTLAKKLISADPSLNYHHFTWESKYSDYLKPMSSLSMMNSVLDRHMISEVPYSAVMDRVFQYSDKQFHNVMLMTLSQYPVIILADHHPKEEEYSPDQYMGYDKWVDCLSRYKVFFQQNNITYISYDYETSGDIIIDAILAAHKSHKEKISWAIPFWEKGIGFTGSSHPVVLIVAERIGPSNSHFLPFEEGPTGYMISEVIKDTHTPLGSIAITNLVKIPKTINRSSMEYKRPITIDDLDLFKEELGNLSPKKVIFMGKISRDAGSGVCDDLKITYDNIIHLGALNHRGITDLTSYKKSWKKVLSAGTSEIVSSIELKPTTRRRELS